MLFKFKNIKLFIVNKNYEKVRIDDARADWYSSQSFS